MGHRLIFFKNIEGPQKGASFDQSQSQEKSSQIHPIVLKLIPIERVRKTNHFSYIKHGLKMNRSKDI